MSIFNRNKLVATTPKKTASFLNDDEDAKQQAMLLAKSQTVKPLVPDTIQDKAPITAAKSIAQTPNMMDRAITPTIPGNIKINPAIQEAVKDQFKLPDVGNPLMPPKQPSQENKDIFSEDAAARAAIRDLLSGKVPGRDAARDALTEELKVKSAENVQATRGRTGLAGMGLTGAAGALENQVRRADTRTSVLAQEEFDQATRDEVLKRLGLGLEGRAKEVGTGIAEDRLGLDKENSAFERELAGKKDERERQAFEAALAQAEAELNKDLNGDGVIGSEKDKEEKKDEAPTFDRNAGTEVNQEDQAIATTMRQRYPNMFKNDAGAVAAITKARNAFAVWSPKHPGVDFETYVDQHLSWWNGPGGYLTRGISLGFANETNWPTE
jgi:hypothetical protein